MTSVLATTWLKAPFLKRFELGVAGPAFTSGERISTSSTVPAKPFYVKLALRQPLGRPLPHEVVAQPSSRALRTLGLRTWSIGVRAVTLLRVYAHEGWVALARAELVALRAPEVAGLGVASR